MEKDGLPARRRNPVLSRNLFALARQDLRRALEPAGFRFLKVVEVLSAAFECRELTADLLGGARAAHVEKNVNNVDVFEGVHRLGGERSPEPRPEADLFCRNFLTIFRLICVNFSFRKCLGGLVDRC